MKNLLDSTLYFSVLTEDSQMQTLALDAAAFTSQTLVTVEDLLNVLQHPDSVSLDEHLVASRSGDDLLLSFRGSEDRPVLTLENFFTGANRLHILRQDGELLRGIVAQDNPQQGPVSFSSEPVGAIAQQPEAPALVALHQATVVEQPVAFSQLLTVNLDLQITHALDQVGARKGILESGKVTDDRWSVLEGTGAADSILEIYDGAELIGEVQVGKNGHWSFEPEQSYEEGGHVFTARVKGSSDTSNAFVLILDSLAPSRVIIERVVDDLTGSPITIGKNGSTADNTPLIEGKAEAYSMVAIYNGKTLIGTSFADANGKWSLTSFFNWPDGQYSITAQAIDHAGNAGLASTAYQFTINATPVVTPVIQQAYDDVGPQQGVLANNAQTDDLQPTLSGTAEANARVEIFDKGVKLGETLADAYGKWTFIPAQPLAEGLHSFTACSTGQTSKVSELSSAWNLTVDITAPSKPGTDGEGPGLHEIGGSDGPIKNGGTTNDNTPTFKGEGEPGDTIIIIDEKSGEVIGETKVDEKGNWELTPNPHLKDGEHEIVVIIEDPAGNQSEKSDPIIIVVDTTAPNAPVIGGVISDVGGKLVELVSGGATNDTTPTFKGTTEANARVDIFDNGVLIGSTVADSKGNWSFTPTLEEGNHSLTTRATDGAGNTSAASPAWNIEIDVSAPSKPGTDGQGPGINDIGGVTNDNTPTFTGKGEPGDTIIILDNNQKIGEVVVGENGTWEFTPETALGDGDHAISIIIQDPAGNQSEPSDSQVITIDTWIAKPTILDVIDDVGSIKGSIANNGVTDDNKPTLSGNAEAGSTVTVKNGNTVLGSVVADASGNWSFTPSTALADGQHVFTVTAQDAAGNTASSDSRTITVDTFTAKPIISAVHDDVGSLWGYHGNNAVIDDAKPTLIGTAEAGSTVSIWRGAAMVATVTADSSGNWTYTPTQALADGKHDFRVNATDKAGNTSVMSDPFSVTIDTTIAKPTIADIIDDVGSEKGSVAHNGVTDDTHPTLGGKAEAGSTVTVKNGEVALGTVVADANDNWTFTPSQPLADGKYTFTVIATDIAGNTSVASDGYTITITSIAKPTILQVVDDVGSIQGNIANNGVTDDSKPTLIGKADAGSTVTVKHGSTVVGAAVADASGNWSFTPSTALVDGQYAFTVVATNKAGIASAESDSYTIVIDTVIAAPSITSIMDDVGSITGNIANNGTTDDNKPTLNGKAEAGSTVTIKNGSTVLGTAKADANGHWSFTPSTTLADGKYAFTVVATDKAGNVSVPSDAYGVTVKSTQTALEWFINDNYGPIQGRVEDGGVTDDNKRLSIFGYAPPELTVIIYGDGKELARVKPNANDKNYWNYTPSELKDGTYTWGVEFVDAAGNKSAYTTKTITVDTQIAKPTISNVIDDVGSITGSIANNGTTDDNKPTLSGTAEAGSTVTVKNGSTVLGTVKADASGNWTFTPGTALADGQYVFTVTAQDLAGNSATSDSHTITVATSSAKPTITAVTDDVGSITGTVANNGVTDDNKPTLSGKADAGSTVTVKNGSTVVGSVVADASGNWSFTPSTALADDQYVFTVVATNKAGIVSPVSDGYTIVVDTVIAKPTITSVTDDVGTITGSIANNGVTDDNKPTLNGKAEAGSTITVKNGSTVIGSVVADASGNWSFTPSTALTEGKYVFTVTAVDKAGNSSVASDAFTITVDTSIAKPSITTATDDFGPVTGTITNNGTTDDSTPTLSGKAEAGATVVIKDGTTVLGSVQANASGNWTFTPSQALAVGKHTFSVVATDVAGNVSVVSDSYIVNIVSPKPSFSVLDDYGPEQGYLTNYGTTDDTVLSLHFTDVITGWYVLEVDGVKQTELFSAKLAKQGYSWSTGALSAGQHKISVTVWDGLGNLVQAYEDFNVSVTAPVPTVINTVTGDHGWITGSISNNSATSDTTPTLTGKALAGTRVRINDGNTELAIVEADSKGNWSFTPSKELTFGRHILTASSIDKDGNAISTSQSFTIIIGQMPNPPTLTELIDDVGPVTGKIGMGGDTDDSMLTLHGKADPGTTIVIHHGDRNNYDQTIGSTVADANGDWSYTCTTPMTHQGLNWFFVASVNPQGISSWPSTGLQYFYNPPAVLKEDIGVLSLVEDYSAIQPQAFGMEESPVLFAEHGSNGNDVIGIRDTSFTLINGGEGVDTVLLDGTNMTLDLDALVDRIHGIEKINLGEGTFNSLSLSADALEHLNPSTVSDDGKKQLLVNGDESSNVDLLDTLSEPWKQAGQAEIDGVAYRSYISGSVELLIEQNIQVTMT